MKTVWGSITRYVRLQRKAIARQWQIRTATKDARALWHSEATREPLWPLSANVTILLAVQLTFWLGVVVTMFAYQVGFLERVR